MQLEVAKILLGDDVALGGNGHAVGHRPLRRAAGLFIAPFRQIITIEQDNRVARCRCKLAEIAGRHHRRLRACRVMDVPQSVRFQRRVLIAANAINLDFFGFGFRGGLREGELGGDGRYGTSEYEFVHSGASGR